MNFGYYKKIVCIPIGISSALKKKKKKQVKSIRYNLSLPETGSDSPIGSDRELGRDKLVSEPRFRRFWKSLCLCDSR